MKRQYITPTLVVMKVHNKDFVLQHPIVGGSKRSLWNLGNDAKKRGNFYEEDEHEEESDSRFYKELW